MASGADLRDRTKMYASRIIKLYSHLQQTHRFDDAAMVLGKQLLRSGTSVAANHREAKHTRSKADRIAKFNIILQELEESALWLELLNDHADGKCRRPPAVTRRNEPADWHLHHQH